MGYYFATKNTAYVVKSLPNPNTVLLSGGQFDNYEVYAPKGLVGEGVRFESALTTPTGKPVGFLLSSLACNRASFSDFGIQV